MLAAARLQTILCVSDLDRAHDFYASLLGLPFRRRTISGNVYDVGGSDLLVAAVRDFAPLARTVIGFAVPDVRAVVADLAARGLACHREDHIQYDEASIATAPDGTRVAWYRDPDGNIFSVVQYPA
jgi:catechol 2,3-dioxygenase-like lactoylglutathione lyase family enzyme